MEARPQRTIFSISQFFGGKCFEIVRATARSRERPAAFRAATTVPQIVLMLHTHGPQRALSRDWCADGENVSPKLSEFAPSALRTAHKKGRRSGGGSGVLTLATCSRGDRGTGGQRHISPMSDRSILTDCHFANRVKPRGSEPAGSLRRCLPHADTRSETGGKNQKEWGRARDIGGAGAGQEAIVRARPQRRVQRWGSGEQG
jgi:hypothetical protein